MVVVAEIVGAALAPYLEKMVVLSVEDASLLHSYETSDPAVENLRYHAYTEFLLVCHRSQVLLLRALLHSVIAVLLRAQDWTPPFSQK